MADKTSKTYEKMIEEIEKVLEQLNNKELPLEEAVNMYKQGMSLVQACSQTLDKVEKDLRIIESDYE